MTHSVPTRRSSDLLLAEAGHQQEVGFADAGRLDDVEPCHKGAASGAAERQAVQRSQASSRAEFRRRGSEKAARHLAGGDEVLVERRRDAEAGQALHARGAEGAGRSEEHTSELQSLMRLSYAVFSLNTTTIS